MTDKGTESRILAHIDSTALVRLLRDCGQEHLRALLDRRQPRIVPLLAANLGLLYRDHPTPTDSPADRIGWALGIGAYHNQRAIPAALWPPLLQWAWGAPTYTRQMAEMIAAAWRQRELLPRPLTAPVIAWETHARLMLLALATVQIVPDDPDRAALHGRLNDLGVLLAGVAPEPITPGEWDTWALNTAATLWPGPNPATSNS